VSEKPARLVLVDDDPADQDLFRIAVANARGDSAVDVYDSVDDALRALRRALPVEPVLLFTDLKMPGRDGIELLCELRGDTDLKHLPVLVLSTSKAPADVRRAHLAGCNAYHTKPMGLLGFEHLLGRILDYWFGETMLPERARV
jgi:CheY-like chemotaxis protein